MGNAVEQSKASKNRKGRQNMGQPQLKLVQTPVVAFSGASADPTRRVFEHWLVMAGRSPARCKLGPTRRQAINAWLTVYDEDMLCAAVEGMASDPLEGCNPSMRAAMRELEWLISSEARIERWAERGFALREQLEAEAAEEARRRAAPPPVVEVEDPAAVAQARQRLADLAARCRGGA